LLLEDRAPSRYWLLVTNATDRAENPAAHQGEQVKNVTDRRTALLIMGFTYS